MVCGHQVSTRLDGHLYKAFALHNEHALLLLRGAVEDASDALRVASIALLRLSVGRCQMNACQFGRQL